MGGLPSLFKWELGSILFMQDSFYLQTIPHPNDQPHAAQCGQEILRKLFQSLYLVRTYALTDSKKY